MLNNTGSMDPFFVKMEHHQNVKGGGGGGWLDITFDLFPLVLI